MISTNQQHPFLDPLWRRVAVVVFCAAWSAMEWANGQTTWGTMTAVATIYGAWTLLYKYEVPKPAAETADPETPAAPD